ncbi:MAG: hypothetical protein HUJ56_06425 [Erysipelotrichaceae bacterium]|nr:hypothetical protein [Erysipelotrichaceae bacterium]
MSDIESKNRYIMNEHKNIVFTEKWLKYSSEYYLPLLCRLTDAQESYFDIKGISPNPDWLVWKDTMGDVEAMRNLEAFGNDVRVATFCNNEYTDFIYIIRSISSLNSGFVKLLEGEDVLAAIALLRLQLDNLTYLIAEAEYPFNILFKVYNKGYKLNQVSINGKKLSSEDIRREYDSKYGTNLNALYDKYYGFIYPELPQNGVLLFDYYKGYWKRLPKYLFKEYTKDMVYLNKIITKLLESLINDYKKGLIKYDNDAIVSID